ncbi:MAG: carbon-nitrogen hydrolase [Elusimicrobia bacterium CG08_land_8_20_14_0_20_51_18]|nr:MAG: carbon-nitrogen hydrolase [Elusimicrobia bacterium CG08_land_8_20_14_0_20_51_18]
MKIGLLQYDMKWEDKEENKKKISALVEKSEHKNKIDWLIFSEMTLSGFTMNTKVSELDDADRAFFPDLARKYAVNVSFGGVEGGYNKLITLNRKGERINEYSKIHLYAFGGEDKYYKSGTERKVFELEGLRVMPAVCFDLRFPYLFWSAAEKADLYVAIAAWPMRRAEHWMTLLRARAVENQAYCFGVNRLGFEEKVEYSGNSMGFDPLGKVIVDCQSREGISVTEADVTAGLVSKTRERFPFLKERKSNCKW